jgi:hypothetical protein
MGKERDMVDISQPVSINVSLLWLPSAKRLVFVRLVLLFHVLVQCEMGMSGTAEHVARRLGGDHCNSVNVCI